MKRIKRFFKEDEGVTALEYGVIAATTIVAIVGILLTVGTNLTGVFSTVAGALVPA